MNILTSIQNAIQGILLYIFRLLSYAIKRLRFVGGPVTIKNAKGQLKPVQKGIPVEDKITDFLEVFRSTRIFLIFNLLAFIVFISLPQGKDVILIVIEDLTNFHFGSLLSLLIGLAGWSIISEFGARYKVYITDNSGISLSDESVNFRKEVQRTVGIFYLFLPTIIVLLSVAIVSFKNITNWNWANIWPFVLVVVLLVLTFAGLSRFYLDGVFINRLRHKKVWYKVDEKELHWIDKLYGIYNDHVLMIRKAENFLDKTELKDQKLKRAYKLFTRILEGLPPKKDIIEKGDLDNFPRDFLIQDELAPPEFKDVKYRPNNYTPYFLDEKNFQWNKNKTGYYRWVYKNNPSFYKTLHRQVKVIAIFSLLILLLISTGWFLPYDVIGSPGLVCMSFGCWLGLYTGLLYLDSRYRRNIHISIRWLVFAWFLVVSFINYDHPVRTNHANAETSRPSLKTHFLSWLSDHKKDTNRIVQNNQRLDTLIARNDTFYNRAGNRWLVIDSPVTKIDTVARLVGDTSYPVFFITAEGGALRTGAFTALLLARLQDSFPQFKHNIYAFSSVSGGSVGVSFFNAISYLEPDTTNKTAHYNETVTKRFFSQDQLSPVIAKMFYADLLNDFWPWPIENFDRAIALEKAWEHSYANIFDKPTDRNVYSTNFVSCYQNNKMPAWFINTTEVETGQQCYISNVVADSFLFAKDRDLLSDKIKGGINYSTAVNFSSRFPLFSPSAALYQNDDQIYHYVDGGYVENTGAKTMLEVLKSLHHVMDSAHVHPYIIQLKFGDSTHFANTGFLNEISSIGIGIYNTRAGASATYTKLLREETDTLKGKFIEVPLNATSNEVPMSWVFSKRSLDNLNNVIDNIMTDERNDIHHNLLPLFNKK